MEPLNSRRRSQRVDLHVPVRITVGDEVLETQTVLVSRHGALVRYPTMVPVGTRLALCNMTSGVELTFRVTWVWPDEEAEGFKLGLEMVDESPSFWGPRYDRLVGGRVT